MARSTYQHYDRESGQVYHETEVVFKRKQHSDWIGELKTPKLSKRPQPNEHGARSLFDMAKAQTVRSMRSMDSDHFSSVSWSVAEKVWEELLATRIESFHAWRTFAKAYSADGFAQSQFRYLLDIKSPPLPLTEYFRGINSPDLYWLTCLRISPRQINTPDLVALAKISNLAVLDLSDGQITIDGIMSTLDERVMRTWAELATDRVAFQHLRVLLLGWQEVVSHWIFKYLEKFPSLHYVIMTDCLKIHQKNRFDWEDEAKRYGWTARAGKRSAKDLRPLLDDRKFYIGAVSSCYYNSLEVAKAADLKTVPDRLPLLECWIGTPRVWSHVVEEFPSTRTVWFDKVFRRPDQIRSEEVKRLRDKEPASQDLRSPPSKRSQARRRPQANIKTAADVLADFNRS